MFQQNHKSILRRLRPTRRRRKRPDHEQQILEQHDNENFEEDGFEIKPLGDRLESINSLSTSETSTSEIQSSPPSYKDDLHVAFILGSDLDDDDDDDKTHVTEF